MLSAPPVPLGVAVVGLGPIGLAVARAVTRDPSFRLAGLVDFDPAKTGRRLTDLGVESDDATAVIDDADALGAGVADAVDVAILCTGSHFDRVAPTLRQLMRKKAHVVSSCEEMAWPWLRHPHLADVIHVEALKAGTVLLGTGVNPGFVMDVLPLTLASMTTNVRRVVVRRVVDAATRRLPLQRKIGATMDPARFRKLATAGQIGHLGLGESVVLVAQGLGRHPMRREVSVRLTPVIAGRATDSALGRIEAGRVCGIHNVGTWAADGLSIELDLVMSVGAAEPADTVEVVGDRTLVATIPGGTPGDTATVAALVNAARVVPRVAAGLRTMLDLPLPGSR